MFIREYKMSVRWRTKLQTFFAYLSSSFNLSFLTSSNFLFSASCSLFAFSVSSLIFAIFSRWNEKIYEFRYSFFCVCAFCFVNYSRVPNKRTGRLLENEKKSHLYALIQTYTFINFQQKAPPIRLFPPILLLIFVLSRSNFITF